MTSFQNHIIIGGKRYPVDCKVRTWETTGLQYLPGMGANKKRKKPIDMVVVHWTGGENPGPSVFKFLKDVRGLGIEFYIDADGVLWQFADPLLVDTADAGAFNDRSLGFEMQSWGWRKKEQKALRHRDERVETIHDREWICAEFYEQQKSTLAAALKTLHDSKTMQFQLKAPADLKAQPYPQLLPPRFCRLFQGVVGHFHLSKEKTDPGLEVFQWMFDRGHLKPEAVQSSDASEFSPRKPLEAQPLHQDLLPLPSPEDPPKKPDARSPRKSNAR